MSNIQVDFEKLDYAEGEALIKELYNPTTIESCSFDEFLKLPKQDGYENNINRVPNNFTTAIDHKDDINMTGVMVLPDPILKDASGNTLEITYQDLSMNSVNGATE